MTVRELDQMLAQMTPELLAGEWAYCCVADEDTGRALLTQAIATFRESEGLSLIVPALLAAEKGAAVGPPMRMIKLGVHSALDAVGLTAAVSSRLAEHGISCNMIAATHHDYIFVPEADADRALAALQGLHEDNR